MVGEYLYVGIIIMICLWGLFLAIPIITKKDNKKDNMNMNIKIYKYELSRTSVPQAIQMPINSTIIKAEMQNDIFCIWAIIATEAKTEFRTFVIIATGELITFSINEMQHIDTIIEKPFVWHVFELKNYLDESLIQIQRRN